MNHKVHLKQLFDQYGPQLKGHTWLSENDRWAELIFCLLLQCSGKEAKDVRSLVSALQNLGLLDIDKLTNLNIPSNQTSVVFTYVLRQHMFTEGDVQRICNLLACVATFIHKNYDGKMQRYLRHHGELMRDELVNAFGSVSLNREQLTRGISLWLQNALSFPISLQHIAVSEFCRTHNIRPQDLWEASDEMNLNFAVVDDILEVAHQIEALENENAGEDGGQ